MSAECPFAASTKVLFHTKADVPAKAVVPQTAPDARSVLIRCITSASIPAAPFKPQLPSTPELTAVAGAVAGAVGNATGAALVVASDAAVATGTGSAATGAPGKVLATAGGIAVSLPPPPPHDAKLQQTATINTLQTGRRFRFLQVILCVFKNVNCPAQHLMFAPGFVTGRQLN